MRISCLQFKEQMTVPKKFVGLHAHSCFSTMDGFGQPEEHIDYVFSNGGDAFALSEHGNMSSFPHAYLKTKEMQKKGKNFKYIPAVEAYLVPSISDWKKFKFDSDEAKKDAKKAALSLKKGDNTAALNRIEAGDIEDDVGTTVENEDESKIASKWNDPVRRRHHLVLLAKSSKGLINLYRLVSKSYKEGFYKFPRIDYKMLKEFGEDIVVSTACLHPSVKILTNFGILSIKEIVERYSNENIHVLSYDENNKKLCFQKVTWGDCTRKNAKIFKITLKNGRILKCTEDHLILTKAGWKKVCDLKSDDEVLSVDTAYTTL